MPTDKRRELAAIMAQLGRQDPAVNVAKMRGVEADEPIEWEAYGQQPQEAPAQGLLDSLLGPGIPGAQAAEPEVPDWLIRLVMQQRKKPPPAQEEDGYGL